MIGIGTRLKELRLERELTIDMMIADMNSKYPQLRLNKSMLSRWENARRPREAGHTHMHITSATAEPRNLLTWSKTQTARTASGGCRTWMS